MYRTIDDQAVQWPVYCTARTHLARIGRPTVVGETRGQLPTVAELDRMTAEQRPVCPPCQLHWLGLPEIIRPPHPADC